VHEAQLPDEIAASIARCIEAGSDLNRLRDELHPLRESSDPRAQFATALFDLDRARRGDAEARNELIDVADRLLVFWRQGSGVRLASLHPALEDLWASASALLSSFEQKRFKKALLECWERRHHTKLLQESIETLQPQGNRRVEFARCLYHLELARQFVDSSRAEFAKRAGLLSEAYQNDAIANELVGDDEGLAHLWVEVKPYLDEFFEMVEEEAARRSRRNALAAAEAEIAGTFAAPASAVSKPPPPQVPSFQTLMRDSGEFRQSDLVGHAPAAGEPSEEVYDLMEAVEDAPPPPAPVDLTPPGAWTTSADGDIDIVEDERPPPPPAPTAAARKHALLDVTLEEDDPDAETLEFWKFATKSLDLLPDPKEPRPATRMLSVESRGERKRLTEYLATAKGWQRNPDARAFSCLLRLLLAGQLKEKSLFGQPNARRAEAFAQAFALLSSVPRAAGHAAMWFELDGPETVQALHRGLDVLTDFLGWCSRRRRDPLDSRAHSDFLENPLG
jgi:hypothetical protein